MGCRVVSNAKTTEASRAREAPANIAAMPTSAAMREVDAELGPGTRDARRSESRTRARRRW